MTAVFQTMETLAFFTRVRFLFTPTDLKEHAVERNVDLENCPDQRRVFLTFNQITRGSHTLRFLLSLTSEKQLEADEDRNMSRKSCGADRRHQ